MAGKQSDGILEILFGVKGGGSVSGESGRQISADLTAIAKNIHPEIQFKLSKNQQSTFQAELDAIAKNLKLNIEANVTKVNMSGSSGTGGSGSRKGGKNGGAGGIRSTQTALAEYKKARANVLALEKRVLALQTSAGVKQDGSSSAFEAEADALRKQINLWQRYAEQRAAIITRSGTDGQRASLASMQSELQTQKQLQAQVNRYDILIQRAKEYRTQLEAMSRNYGVGGSFASKYNTVSQNLSASAANPSMPQEQQQARIAQAEQLKQAYDELLSVVSAANQELANPLPKFASDAEAKDYIQKLGAQLEEAKQKVEAFRQAFDSASQTLTKGQAAAQTALTEYKKTISAISDAQKALLKADGSGTGADAERQTLKAKLALLEEYARKQAEIIALYGTQEQKEKLASAQTTGNLKDETARYDAVIQKVKEYSSQLQSLRDKYDEQKMKPEVGATVGALEESAKDPSLSDEQQQARIAQAEQLKKAYNDAKHAIDSANYALSHPQTEFDSSADAEMYIQNFSDQLEYAKQRVEEFRQAFSGAKHTLEGDAERLRIDKAFAGASKSAEEFYAKYQRLISANDEFSRKWSELLAKLRNRDFKGPDEAVTAVRELITETTRAGVTVETFGQKLQRAFGTHFLTALTAIASNTLRKALREIYQNVVELDDALTEFSIVSGKTGNELSDFADKAFESAQRLRAGVTDVIDAATVYSRLGFNDQDSMKYAELTTMFSKVGDVEISDAESNITALVKAYNVGADELELALDKIVTTGNNFAISSAEIGEGLNNAASALAANGNTLEQSIALLTAAQTVTQNAAKSSTALRTIAARLTNSKAELEELGESTDDLAGSTSKYRKELLALTGVDIQDQNGQFKSTYEILKEIADQWERIGEAGNQEAVATLVSGTRIQPVFYSIMQNFQDALKVMDSMEGAGGTMAESYATYTESISGHLEQIKTTFAELAKDVLSSDLVKTVLDIANGLLKVVDSLAKAKVLIPAIVAAIASIKLTKNGAGRPKKTGFRNMPAIPPVVTRNELAA